MKGRNKALVEFNGVPLLQRIKSRLQPQVSRLLVNLAEATDEYRSFELELCLDINADAGPLMGLASAFRQTDAEQNIQLCPCDAPFVPENLVVSLTDMMMAKNADIVCPLYGGELQPTFALWNRTTARRVITAVTDEGIGGLKALYSRFDLATLEWPQPDQHQSKPNPFFNINTQEELSLALNYLES
jgi:molybdopterin-guanine dinucleotide biosynthesis protein A